MTNVVQVITDAQATFNLIMPLVAAVLLFSVAVPLVRRFCEQRSEWTDHDEQYEGDGVSEGWEGYTNSERMDEMGWDGYDAPGTWDHEDSV